MSRGGDLYRVQQIDERLAGDLARLAEVEGQIAADPELDRRRATASRAEKRHRRESASVATMEAAVEGLRARTRTLDRHLYDGSVGNPQELLTMQRELDGLRARVAAEEETLLAAMERAEEAALAARDAVAAVVEREQVRADGAGRLLQEATALRTLVEAEAADRREAVAAVNEADLALYERLRARVKPAVVRLSGDACGGCHLPMSPAEARRARGPDLVQCSNCDRIVIP